MTPHERKNVLKQIVQIVQTDSPNISLLKSLVIFAIWLALSNVICSRTTLFYALNHLCSKSRNSCSKDVISVLNRTIFALHCTISASGTKWDVKASLFRFKETGYLVKQILVLTEYGCDKVVIEFRDVQFWSEIILLWFQIELTLFACPILKSRVWFQTKLPSTQTIYQYQ